MKNISINFTLEQESTDCNFNTSLKILCRIAEPFYFVNRAILCRDCDPLTHQANDHNQNHNRFLLVGINLSTSAKHHESLHPMNLNLEKMVPPNVSSQSFSKLEPMNYNMDNGMKSTTMENYGVSGSASTISEYLTEILPGWKVEDLLDSIASPPRLSEFAVRSNPN
ncbi:LOW QUALITY PROTEIN: hypothetical protein V2J09_023825 [Rumex salicifolius]